MFYSDVILKTGELEGEICIKIEGLILRIVVRHPVDFRYSLFELGIGIRIPRCFRIVKYFRGNVFNLRAGNEARTGNIWKATFILQYILAEPVRLHIAVSMFPKKQGVIPLFAFSPMIPSRHVVKDVFKVNQPSDVREIVTVPFLFWPRVDCAYGTSSMF